MSSDPAVTAAEKAIAAVTEDKRLFLDDWDIVTDTANAAERDAANATLARIQAVAAVVDQDGGHSGPSLARHILNIIGGEA